MTTQLVLSFYEQNIVAPEKKHNSEWGTFKDSLRAPIHRWFTYPAGFSHKAVEHSIERYGIIEGQTIYDPFMGSGTTNLVAKTLGINSVGTEAHPFVYQITKAKLNWDIELKSIKDFTELIRKKLPNKSGFLKTKRLQDEFPELILKCYEEKTLYDLWALRELIAENLEDEGVRGFFFVVVTAMLRNVSIAATGWPYIAPNKVKTSSINKDVLVEFVLLTNQMANDIQIEKFETQLNQW
jgi:adenine-specific DNA methylase